MVGAQQHKRALNILAMLQLQCQERIFPYFFFFSEKDIFEYHFYFKHINTNVTKVKQKLFLGETL